MAGMMFYEEINFATFILHSTAIDFHLFKISHSHFCITIHLKLIIDFEEF